MLPNVYVAKGYHAKWVIIDYLFKSDNHHKIDEDGMNSKTEKAVVKSLQKSRCKQCSKIICIGTGNLLWCIDLNIEFVVDYLD